MINQIPKYKTHIVCATVLALAFLVQNPNIYQQQFFYGLLLCAGFFAFQLARHTNVVYGMALFYFFASGILQWASPNKPELWELAISLSSSVVLLFSASAIACFPSWVYRSMRKAFIFLCFASSFLMVIKFALGFEPYSFMNNSAADACMIAVLFPFIAMDTHEIDLSDYWFLAFVPVLACIVSGSSTGIVAMSLSIAFSVYFSIDGLKSMKWLRAAFIGGTFSAFPFIGVMLFKESFLNDNGRFSIWENAMKYWWQHHNIWLGAGPGKFYVEGPMNQILSQVAPGQNIADAIKANPAIGNSLFTFMHNEYLQVLYEQGIIGLILFLSVGIVAFYKSNKKPHKVALIVLGFTMLTQFPLRYFLSSFLVLVLLGDMHEGKRAA